MKRPLRKLISFTSAAAVLTNALTVTAFAAQTATPVSEDGFSQMILYPDKAIYVQNTDEQTQLVMIGADGQKKTAVLEQGASQLRFSSTKRQFRGGTSSVYTFDYDEPAFMLAAKDNGCLVMKVQEDGKTKYKLLSTKTGKAISEAYDKIRRLSEHLYQVERDVESHTSVYMDDDGNEVSGTASNTTIIHVTGLMDQTGKVIYSTKDSNKECESFAVTPDEKYAIVKTDAGYFFIDMDGKAVSEVYPEIIGMSLHDSWGRGEWRFPDESDVSGQYTENVYRFKLGNGKYAFGVDAFKPTSQEYDYINIIGRYNSDTLTDGVKQEYALRCTAKNGEETSTDWYTLDGSKLEKMVYTFRLNLTKVDGTRPYLINTVEDSGMIYEMDGNTMKVHVLSAQLIVDGYTKILLKSGDKYQLYDNQMQLLGTYDDYCDLGWSDGFALTKGKTTERFDRNLNPIPGSYPADFISRYQAEKITLYSNNQAVGYLVQPDAENKPYIWMFWDTNYNNVKGFMAKAQHGGTLESAKLSLTPADDQLRLRLDTTESTADGTKTYVDYYVLNEAFQTMPVTKEYTAMKGCGENFCVKTPAPETPPTAVPKRTDGRTTDSVDHWMLVDYVGNKQIECTYDDFLAFKQEENGETEYYYAGISKDEFTVYNSNGKELCTVSGTPVTDTVYQSGGKYGLYSLKTGALTEAEYMSAASGTGVNYFRTDDGTGYAPLANRVYPLRKGDTVCYFDGTGKLRQELESTANIRYTFDSVTSSAYDLSNLVLNDKTANGKGRTYIYDGINNVVKYQQTGKYDRVSKYQDGYLIAEVKSEEGAELWTNGSDVKQALVRAKDGAEVIRLTGDVKINSLSPYDYNLIDWKYKAAGTSAGLCVNVRGIHYSNMSTDVNIPVQDLDAAYAKKYGYDLAVKTDYGKYAAMKDGTWCIADANGKQVTDAKYDCITDIYEGMAFAYTVNETEVESTEQVMNPETGLYEERAITLKRISPEFALISFEGKELLKSDNTSYMTTWISEDEKTYGAVLRPRSEELDVYKNIAQHIYKQSDFNNEFAKKYGYDLAVQYAKNLYVVQKDGLKGLVNEKNSVIVPIKYADLVACTPDQKSLSLLSEEERQIFSKKPFSTPLITFSDGSVLVNFKTADGKIEAFMIQEDNAALKGDLNGDGLVTLKDVVLLRRSIAGGWEVTVDAAKADINDDGTVNLKDVVKLRRMIAGGFD